ncbi:MAG: peptidoglycan DD-metalloendopeptidase family protein [Sulfurimonas sp.]|nr:peptidoglycan DD-metalloendopeptidase family protein [Sulfurimonas sp.]MDQ7061176.1 peptidoglycan DD-metalloendopeptidase family protein [Sulfurimonas sp.]
MMRLILVLFFSFCMLFAKENIDTKIKSTSTQISSFSNNYTKLNKQMAKNAKAILNQRLKIQKQQKFLKNLNIQLSDKELSYKENKYQLEDLIKFNKNLKTKQNSIEQELIFVVAQSVSLSVILEGDYSTDEESLMEFEILQQMLKGSKDKANTLNIEFNTNASNIAALSNQANSLKKSIADIDSKRKKLISTKKKNKKSLKKLQLAKSSYKSKLKKLLKKQDALKKTLAKLNIIKVDTIKRKEEERLRAKAFDNKKILLDENLPKVKKHGSSYQAIKTKKYKGAKTIAPLDSYSISKKYGTYTDPIYGIKIFNESISLKPTKPNAKVKTVFNGKVIYADKTAVLNNIVIIEHTNGLHTIYANLSQIAPNIKKGKKIKKGYSIGRVNEELIFEVTQKSYHINPIRLFK